MYSYLKVNIKKYKYTDIYIYVYMYICIYVYMYMHIEIQMYMHIYIYMVAPPQGLPEREGVYHLPSVVLNTFKDMLRKHCKFQCFMHILLVLF